MLVHTLREHERVMASDLVKCGQYASGNKLAQGDSFQPLHSGHKPIVYLTEGSGFK